jgi:hypothetical protein
MAMYPGQRRESPIHNIRGGYKECLWKCRRTKSHYCAIGDETGSPVLTSGHWNALLAIALQT